MSRRKRLLSGLLLFSLILISNRDGVAQDAAGPSTNFVFVLPAGLRFSPDCIPGTVRCEETKHFTMNLTG